MSERNYKAWTPDEDARLMAMVGAGTLHKQIAYLLGRTKESVSTRIKLLRKARAA